MKPLWQNSVDWIWWGVGTSSLSWDVSVHKVEKKWERLKSERNEVVDIQWVCRNGIFLRKDLSCSKQHGLERQDYNDTLLSPLPLNHLKLLKNWDESHRKEMRLFQTWMGNLLHPKVRWSVSFHQVRKRLLKQEVQSPKTKEFEPHFMLSRTAQYCKRYHIPKENQGT